MLSAKSVAAAALLVAVLLLPRSEPPAPVRQAATELATDYLPIGYGPGLRAGETVQVIRIRLPRSEMVRFGLPVQVERAHQPVQADVLIGEDGLARAIRFVQ